MTVLNTILLLRFVLQEKRFAQAEISQYTTVAVVTRFKRDYVSLSKRTSKIVFSADQRVSFTAPKSSFNNKGLLMLQVRHCNIKIDPAGFLLLRTK